MSRRYDTALRPYLQKRLEEIGEADIIFFLIIGEQRATTPILY